MTTSKTFGQTLLVDGQNGAEDLVNRWLFFAECRQVINSTTNAPPGSPSQGDAYIIGPSPTGDWATHAGKLTIYLNGWRIAAPISGVSVYDLGATELLCYSETAPIGWFPVQDRWSTTEHFTGKFRDGSAVYSKVVDMGVGPNATTKSIAHGITGLDQSKPVILEAAIRDTAGGGVVHPARDGHLPVGSFGGADFTVTGTNVVWESNINMSVTHSTKVRLEYSKA